MTEDYFKQHVVKALERIADALEAANMREAAKLFASAPNVQPLPSVPANGYQCWRCHQWIPTGVAHACGISFGGVGSQIRCGAHGTTGGTCYLPKDHSVPCQFAVCINAVP